tara:strand:- start:289 stop:1287 length:999 start_codon:yes stop_codon:yes gene_type:complete
MYFFLTYSIFVVLVSIFLKKKKFFLNYTGDKHQLFSNKKNIPLVGGIFLIIPLIFINYQNIVYSILLILIFLLGFLSDQKILISAKKRFLIQIALVFFSVIFLDLEILSSKLIFFDYLLKNSIFNIFFTSFCLLILINGSNFMDGLNGLLLSYMTFIIFILLKLGLLNELLISDDLVNYLIFFIIIIILLNLSNYLMLGDTGAYILSFFVGYLIIKCHISNPNISPYFFISLLWYPCYENLFSIIRKLKSKLSPLIPDNKHLHQLIYARLKKKIFKDKLIANNVSSLLITFTNFIIILISSINPYSSIYQIKLIIFSVFLYSFLFILIKKRL